MGNYNPQEPIRRSECTKVISAFIMMEAKPTIIFPGGGYIEYIKPSTEADNKQIDAFTNNDLKHGPNFSYKTTSENFSQGISPSWAKISHQTITDFAYELLKDNTGEGGREYIYTKLQERAPYNNLRPQGISLIKEYAWYTDEIENDYGYLAHFYDPDLGRSYNAWTYFPGIDETLPEDMNAYKYFNNHFYNACLNYRYGNKYTSYCELGMAIHYLEDLTNPYHASNKVAVISKHTSYEDWVDSPNIMGTANTTMTYSSYRYVYDSTFLEMANNFAGLAKSSFDACNLFDYHTQDIINEAITATHKNLTRAQRAVCGLLNRFYYNAGLNG